MYQLNPANDATWRAGPRPRQWRGKACLRGAVRDANDDIPASRYVAAGARSSTGRGSCGGRAEDAERACDGLRRTVQPDTADAAGACHGFGGTGEPDSIKYMGRAFRSHRIRRSTLKLGRSIDSGHLKNGDTVAATLAKPVALSPKGTLDAGTPAELTVVETLPAGRIYASGEFSLQLERVGSVTVYTDTLTYRGKPGHKDLPDSAPAVGTDAALAAGAELVFHVLPPPAPANGPPKAGNRGPGSVDGVASGTTRRGRQRPHP